MSFSGPAVGGDDSIRIVGAREHNLKDVSLTIPKNRITVFTGVSGSGKSSIVFDTVAVEAQRQLHGTFSWFIRNQLPKYERPQADAIENLTTPVIVDQKPVGGNARSTVGTMTDIYSMIRALFARYGSPTDGRVSTYSFNDPQGMCPECDGLGKTVRADVDKMLDHTKSLDEGAILLPGYTVGGTEWQLYANHEGVDPAKRLSDYTEDEWHTLLHGTGGKVELTVKSGTYKVNYEGLVVRFTRLGVKRDLSAVSDRTRESLQRFITEGTCPACDGDRLNPTALATLIDGRTIADWSRMQVTDLIEVLGGIDDPVATPIAEAARTALARVAAIGLGYLSMDRATMTLSGGEGQRLKMVRHLGSSLTGMTYIFDEPSVGLHPRDVGRLNDLLRALRDQGNTVLVVEHDPDVIEIADHVVDVGPRAGVHGGEIVFTGTVERLREADTLTARGLRGGGAVKDTFRQARGALSIADADLHNLKKVSVDIPVGVLTAVTGVAGSGKSTLIGDVFMAAYPDTIFVDQTAIAASSRSTPATYLGLMDQVRKLFATASGVAPGLFSFNSTGACEECQGRGVIITELAYMDPVTTHCDTCDGRRFKESVLSHTLRGKSIADVLEMPAEEAAEFFTERALRAKLHTLIEVGLGYLSLGQSLSTLSGGERQRIKLATQLHRTGGVYVLDEPTTGLHMSDVDTLLTLMNGLVDKGNTVIVIEHNLDVIQQADWIIDLGPDGGKNGGEIVFTGTPRDLLAAEHSLTGEHLRRYRLENAAT
ncbi:excinuclease ABC subunit UvrA [Streptosporangium sp. KLBMP 9127]|nr:excinuclease ABC subunit UvrA [Streptosporangium sp. KLBMP 9127]